MSPRVSVVTPTFRRPVEVRGLLENLAKQTHLPYELILVDGAPPGEEQTAAVVKEIAAAQPFSVVYVRFGGGTAIQRNTGIDRATGEFIAFADDDVRFEPGYLEQMLRVFSSDNEMKVGGVVGYRTNQHFRAEDTERWRWYRRLGLLRTFEPGRYDFECGYPINANMQPPFSGTREVSFMTTSNAVWRRTVFDSGLRFDMFFRDYGMLEDAHLSLRAGKRWKLLQCGDARCEELHAAGGRPDRRRIGYKCVVNYYYVFRDIAGPLSIARRFRFWRYQAFELIRVAASAVRRRQYADWEDVQGRVRGFVAVMTGSAFSQSGPKP